MTKTQLGEFLLGGISRQLEILQLGELILGGIRSECACPCRIIQLFAMFWKIIINNILNFSLQLHESTGAHAIVCTYPQLGYFFLGGIFELRLPAFLPHTFSNTSTNYNIVAVSLNNHGNAAHGIRNFCACETYYFYSLILDSLCIILHRIAVLTKSAGSMFDMHRLVQMPGRKK